MIKSILRLLAASASFVVLLLTANSAIAAIPLDYSINQGESPVVSLNVVSPTLQLIGKTNGNSLDHTGCSCALCTQGVKQIIR